jgi:dTDP-4-amino-4,6-dideoxygalactose transaminase
MPIHYPTAGTPYLPADVLRAVLGFLESAKIIRDFELALQKYLGAPHLALVNSGTTACYLLLEVFKEIRHKPQQDEVIMPAYTAPSLLLPIRAAGLKPVLVDIDAQTFNMAIDQVAPEISDRTLAVMPVHMFGLPCELDYLDQLCRERELLLFEDAASSLGTTINGVHTGTLAPFGFYSLNRGKNISTLTGGIITWKENKYTDTILKKVHHLKSLNLISQKLILAKIIGLSLAVRPIFYTALASLIARYKYTTLHTTFDSYAFPRSQAAFGKSVWQRAADLTTQRLVNGRILYSIFAGKAVYQLPLVKAQWKVAFNQFPLIVKDLCLLAELQRRLLAIGIETTRLYEKPLHHLFPELHRGGGEPFPNATFLAEHLLLIPVHPQIRREQLAQIRDIVMAIS